MPKPTMSIAELEQLLAGQKKRLEGLRRKKDRLNSEIEKIDAEVASLKGSPVMPKRARRVRKKGGKSLRESVLDVLKASPQPMTAPEIADAVRKAGYRSSSKNFVFLVKLVCYRSNGIRKVGKGTFTIKGGK